MQTALFEQPDSEYHNLLPSDGEAYFIPRLLDEKQAQRAFEELLNGVAWENDTHSLFNRTIVTRRKTGWYGDAPFRYTYSGTTRVALKWSPELLRIKSDIEAFTRETFNSCLLNFYHDGQDGMGWHSDNEPELKPQGTIASLSLGAERRFLFKHKQSGEKRELVLTNGSLLLMHGTIQKYWLHSVPKMRKVAHPRINLTFRTIVAEN